MIRTCVNSFSTEKNVPMSNATMEGVSRIDNTIDELKLEGPWEDQNQKLIFYRGNSETYMVSHYFQNTLRPHSIARI